MNGTLMTRLLIVLLLASTGAVAQPWLGGPKPREGPNPALVVATEQVKERCAKETPCKYRVDDRGPVSVVTVEFSRKDASGTKLEPAGKSQLTIDKKGNVVKRVDSD